MATTERARDRGTLRGEHWLAVVAKEFRAARLTIGLSQRRVAGAVAIPRSTYSLIERGKLARLSMLVAARIAAVLGLDLFVALYPGPQGLRDQGSAKLIQRVISEIGPPMKYRTEVGLPKREGIPDQRSWDLMTFGDGERTGFEFEMRLHDAQAQTRRHNLKRRDDPVDHFVLVLADTRHNRRILHEFAELFSDLPLLATSMVLATLKAGQHPSTGVVLIRGRPADTRPPKR